MTPTSNFLSLSSLSDAQRMPQGRPPLYPRSPKSTVSEKSVSPLQSLRPKALPLSDYPELATYARTPSMRDANRQAQGSNIEHITI